MPTTLLGITHLGQWAQIADVCDERGLYPFFDCAYQGFASGNLNNDAWAVRYFVNRGLELLVCQSFAKNFGLYGQRVGALHVVFADSATKKAAATQLELLQRAEISNPPAYGARIVSRILTNAELFSEWERDLLTMANRINDMRIALRKHLEQLELRVPGIILLARLACFRLRVCKATRLSVSSKSSTFICQRMAVSQWRA